MDVMFTVEKVVVLLDSTQALTWRRPSARDRTCIALLWYSARSPSGAFLPFFGWEGAPLLE